jgi:hypothetical protein
LCEFVLRACIALLAVLHLSVCRVSREGSCVRDVVLSYVSFWVSGVWTRLFQVKVFNWRWGGGLDRLIGRGVCGGVFSLLASSCVEFHVVWYVLYWKQVYWWASGIL